MEDYMTTEEQLQKLIAERKATGEPNRIPLRPMVEGEDTGTQEMPFGDASEEGQDYEHSPELLQALEMLGQGGSPEASMQAPTEIPMEPSVDQGSTFGVRDENFPGGEEPVDGVETEAARDPSGENSVDYRAERRAERMEGHRAHNADRNINDAYDRKDPSIRGNRGGGPIPWASSMLDTMLLSLGIEDPQNFIKGRSPEEIDRLIKQAEVMNRNMDIKEGSFEPESIADLRRISDVRLSNEDPSYNALEGIGSDKEAEMLEKLKGIKQ